jgi:hypothetical protein
MWSTWDRLTVVSTYGPPGSEEEDKPDSGWDFSGLGNPSAMRDFMTACDYCLSNCSDDGHSLDDEGCGPSRECFHVDLGGHDEGNHFGMPEDGDPSGHAPRVDILRELDVVLVPAGGQDTQLEQIREMQAKLDEEAGQLVQLRQNIEQEWAGRALAGEARHQARDVQHRIADDARARLPPASSEVGQNLAAATILLRAMPEPSTTEGRRIQGELKNLLEDAAVRWAKRSASRRQGYPPEHRAATSRLVQEASVHTGRTRDATPAAPGHLGNDHHRRDRRARLDEKVRQGYHPRRGGRYDSEEDRSPSPEPPGPQAFSRAIRRASFPTRFRAPTTITKYSGETRLELWLADYRLVGIKTISVFSVFQKLFSIFFDRNQRYRYFSEPTSVIIILFRNRYRKQYKIFLTVLIGSRFQSEFTEFRYRNFSENKKLSRLIKDPHSIMDAHAQVPTVSSGSGCYIDETLPR